MTTTMTRDVGPTADSYVSNELRDAIDRIAAQAERHRQTEGLEVFESLVRDNTPGNRTVLLRLQALGKRLGYTSHLREMGFRQTPYGLAFLSGQTVGYPQLTISMHRGLTPAARARTWAHEIAHIILGHSPRTASQLRYKRMTDDGQEHWWEEMACELAAASVASTMGFADIRYSVDYMAGKLNGRKVTQSVKDAALLAARVLWAALNEAA